MAGQRYEIVVEGVAGPGVRAAFDDCLVEVRCAATRLRPNVGDEAAFYAVLDRVRELGLTLLEVHQLDTEPAVDAEVDAEEDVRSI